MKKYINKLATLFALVVFATSCDSDAPLTSLIAVSFPSAITSSSSTLVLTEDTADATATTIAWPAVTFPVEAPVLYTVQFDLPANTSGNKAWLTAQAFEAGNDVLSKSFTVRDLNKIATDLGLQPYIAGKLAVRVVAVMDRNVYSNPIALTVTPYVKAVVFGSMYMPGAYQGWAIETASELNEIESGVFQGYLTAPADALGFKINPERNWEGFYGAGASNEDMVFKSDTDFQLPGAGSFQIKANTNSLKWSATPYTWGIVGDGTPGSWDKSTPMSFDHVNKIWTVTVDLKVGALKFRLNNSWDINYGQKDSTSGEAFLDDSGAYSISESGTYVVTFTIAEAAVVIGDKGTFPAQATYTVIKK